MYEENARKINSALAAINPELTLEVITLGQPGSMLAVEQRLDQGHAIGILADRGLAIGEEEIYVSIFSASPRAFRSARSVSPAC